MVLTGERRLGVVLSALIDGVLLLIKAINETILALKGAS
jgi:hypothetical protein